MERQDTVKQTGKSAKVAAEQASEAQLTDVSVTRTGARPADPGQQAAETSKTIAEPAPITSEQRLQLIAEAAYFRAQARGFEGGDPIADWLDAEREVDQSIGDIAD